MTHRPVLGADPADNRRALQDILDAEPGGTLELPPGEHTIADGLRVPGGWIVTGSAERGTWLSSAGTTGHPVLHVTGSDVAVRDLGLRPPPADPGEHGGDRGTAVTVGDYLYRDTPEWIERVDLRGLRIERPGERNANCVALMGAVRDITVHDLDVTGGYTAVAVHWGAAGANVHAITGPTYHPHRLTVTDLRVRDAVEGFYLSSVHDVRVAGACLQDVEMGFRLLPGDNTDRFVPSTAVGSAIEISGICVRWNGPLYAVRVAGWGRSEVDGVVSTLRYRDTVVRDCVLRGAGSRDSWSPVVVERAEGVELRAVSVTTDRTGPCCALAGTG